MKLSEAIAKDNGLIFDAMTWLAKQSNGKLLGCALGNAFVSTCNARTVNLEVMYKKLTETYPELNNTVDHDYKGDYGPEPISLYRFISRTTFNCDSFTEVAKIIAEMGY